MSRGRLPVTLGGKCVHRRKVLPAVTLTVLASFMQKRAIAVIALFVTEEGRAVFRGTKLRPILSASL